jgi:hypothetical protein
MDNYRVEVRLGDEQWLVCVRHYENGRCARISNPKPIKDASEIVTVVEAALVEHRKRKNSVT